METFDNLISKLISKLIKNGFQFSKSDKAIVENAINYISNQYPKFDTKIKTIFDNAIAVAKMPEKATIDLVNNIKNCLIKKDFKSIGDLFLDIKGLGVKQKTKTKAKTRRKTKTKNRKTNAKKRKARQYGGDTELCSICRDIFDDHENGVPITLHAGVPPHRFHLNCIAEWLNTRHTCPNCNAGIGIGTEHPTPEPLRAKLAEMQPTNGNGGYYSTIFWVVVLGVVGYLFYILPRTPAEFPFDPNAPYSFLDNAGGQNPNYDPYAIDSNYYDGRNLEPYYYVFQRPR